MECGNCRKVFATEYNRDRHESNCRERQLQRTCGICNESFRTQRSFAAHVRRCSEGGSGTPVVMTKRARIEAAQGQLYEVESAFGSNLRTFFLPSTSGAVDAMDFLTGKVETLHRLIVDVMEGNDHSPVKYNLVLEAEFENVRGEKTDRAFKTRNTAVYVDTSIEESLMSGFRKMITEMEESTLKGSGWSLKQFDGVLLRVNKFTPLGGSGFIPLPAFIAARKAVINVQNNDDQCFRYAILSRLVEKDPQRVKKYRNLPHGYNFDCISFPTPLQEVKKFEKYNNISVNVFTLGENGNVYPLKVVEKEKEDHRDLLLLTTDDGRSHYAYIKDFNRLVNSQASKHQHRIHVCKRCFTHFNDVSTERLNEHMEYCGGNRPTRIVLPECRVDGSKPTVSFINVQKQLRLPIVVYADFESVLVPVSDNDNASRTFTTRYQRHQAMSFCVYVKVAEEVPRHCLPADFPVEPIIYTGEGAAAKFLEVMKAVAEKVALVYSMKRPMLPLIPAQLEDFRQSRSCYLCKLPFRSDNIKVADHDHITGTYRGAAHSKCNILYRTPKFLPVFLHNLSGYDSHYIVRELGYDTSRIEVIPHTEERYISFSKQMGSLTVRFVDTFRFMSSSLDKLAKNLPGSKFIETTKFFPAQVMDLVIRKGVYPYDYVDSFDRLDETVLPPKEAFYNRLNECHISDEDYQHAQSVWEAFGIRTLGEYSELYLKVDVMLLCDVFENFRGVCMEAYSLDPAWYFTAPGLAWDAMLKFTRIRLELLTDYDQLLMIERGIRGGVCQCSHRYAKADNAYLYPDRDPSKEPTYIAYLDANNLYGWAMSNALPYGGFEWVENPDSLNWNAIDTDGTYGFIVEADIEYPDELHDLHNDFPLLPENKPPPGCSNSKLLTTLSSKEKYVVHLINLKQAMGFGLRLVHVHRALRFKQSHWLRPYIELNTDRRKQATNDFEKDFYKLMNNAVFGKFMEDVRKRMKIELVTDERRLRKLIAKPTFKDRTIYTETLVGVHMDFEQITMNKPIYIGLAVLDLSKVRMYDFHYRTMLPKYGLDRLRLLYTDTDSFLYRIRTRDFYEDLLTMLDDFDTSDYPVGHPCYSRTNLKVLGKFKDEANGVPVSEFVGLRAKMYALLIRGQERKKAKGIKRSAVENKISFNDYRTALFDREEFRTSFQSIQSNKHELFSVKQSKTSLSPYDDKRHIRDDGISTFAHGHFSITDNRAQGSVDM